MLFQCCSLKFTGALAANAHKENFTIQRPTDLPFDYMLPLMFHSQNYTGTDCFFTILPARQLYMPDDFAALSERNKVFCRALPVTKNGGQGFCTCPPLLYPLYAVLFTVAYPGAGTACTAAAAAAPVSLFVLYHLYYHRGDNQSNHPAYQYSRAVSYEKIKH